MLAARAVTAIAVCTALGGCGAAVSSQPERVRSTVDAFRLACVREDPRAVLHTLSPPQRETFMAASTTLDGCATVAGIEAAADSEVKAALEAADVDVLEVHGDTASAALVTPEAYDDGVVDLDSTGLAWELHEAVQRR